MVWEIEGFGAQMQDSVLLVTRLNLPGTSSYDICWLENARPKFRNRIDVCSEVQDLGCALPLLIRLLSDSDLAEILLVAKQKLAKSVVEVLRQGGLDHGLTAIAGAKGSVQGVAAPTRPSASRMDGKLRQDLWGQRSVGNLVYARLAKP